MPLPRIVELRRYRLRPGARETLIELFEREFVETQEACGMTLLGQFRDLDAPDAFVWMRAFADAEARLAALAGFYGGQVWAEHAGAARAAMLNTADARMLAPLGPCAPLLAPPARAAPGIAPGVIVATQHHLAPGAEADFAAFFETEIRPRAAALPGRFLGALTRFDGANLFPRLPIQPDPTLAWLIAFPDPVALAQAEGAMAGPDWAPVRAELSRLTWRPDRVLRLSPTARSRLR